MVLESTVICIDNSEYMRNGDFLPNRLIAQQEAVMTIFYSKTNDNPESTVALLSQSNQPEVLCTLTTDASRFISKLLLVQPSGQINLLCSVRIAQMVLKHRRGRNHKMRIIVFVGSVVNADQTELTQLAKKLKKEKVSVDLINFGEEKNVEMFNAFIKELEGTSSHLVTVPSGAILTDAISNSLVIRGEDGSDGRSIASQVLGVDPNQDPELAMALRISMEEQRQRMDASNIAGVNGSNNAGVNENSTGSGTSSTDGKSDEELMAEAIAMSLMAASNSGANSSTTSSVEHSDVMPDFASMTDDERIDYVLRLSLQDVQNEKKSSANDEAVDVKDKEKVEVRITKLDNGHETQPKTSELKKASDDVEVNVDNKEKGNKTTVPMETDNAVVSDNQTKIVEEYGVKNTGIKINRKSSPKTRLQKKKLKEHEENSGSNTLKSNESPVRETDNDDANTGNNGISNKKTRKTPPNTQRRKSDENAKKKSKKDSKKQKRK